MLHMKAMLTAISLAAVMAVGVSAQEGPREGARRGPAKRGGDFFERNDADKDGKVTLEELVAPAKKLLEAGDTDGDGALTREEMKAAREKLHAKRTEGQDRPEGRPEGGRPEGGRAEGRGPRGEGRREGGPPAGGRAGNRPGGERPPIDEIFKGMDTDGNGQVSLEEFKAAHEKRMRAR